MRGSGETYPITQESITTFEHRLSRRAIYAAGPEPWPRPELGGTIRDGAGTGEELLACSEAAYLDLFPRDLRVGGAPGTSSLSLLLLLDQPHQATDRRIGLPHLGTGLYSDPP